MWRGKIQRHEDFGAAKEDWFKTFLGLRNGIPSNDTFNRLFTALDPQQFLDCFLQWTATLQALETVEKDHGRLEIRRYYQSDYLDWFADREQWEGLRSVGVVESIREIAGKVTCERRYYLSSLKPEVEIFARAVRGHWGVENKLHWVMDVCFGEDQSRARTGFAAENLATLRRLALNLLKRDQTKKRGIKGKQRNAGWDHTYLLSLLGVQPEAI